AIAQAVIERLCVVTGARTLFATHYHELAGLAETLPRLGAWRMEVAERDGQAIFLRRVVRGASDHSYGVQVARMAGRPVEVALALASVNLVAVTPLEALNLLVSLQQRALASLGMSSSTHPYRERG